MKRIALLLLSLVLLFSFTAVSACAEEAIQPRDSAYFDSYGTTMSRQGNGTLKITFSTVGTGVCSQLGVATYSVQKQFEDGRWEDVTGLLSGQTGSGVVSYTFSRYFYGVAGETYRVQVTFISAINGGLETKSYTSGKITAK